MHAVIFLSDSGVFLHFLHPIEDAVHYSLGGGVDAVLREKLFIFLYRCNKSKLDACGNFGLRHIASI